jgi:hypothetical protein
MVQQAMIVSRIGAIQRGSPVAMSLEGIADNGGGVLFAWQDSNANEQEDGGEPRVGEWRVRPQFRIVQEAANPCTGWAERRAAAVSCSCRRGPAWSPMAEPWASARPGW